MDTYTPMPDDYRAPAPYLRAAVPDLDKIATTVDKADRARHAAMTDAAKVRAEEVTPYLAERAPLSYPEALQGGHRFARYEAADRAARASEAAADRARVDAVKAMMSLPDLAAQIKKAAASAALVAQAKAEAAAAELRDAVTVRDTAGMDALGLSRLRQGPWYAATVAGGTFSASQTLDTVDVIVSRYPLDALADLAGVTA